jgi:hypothetical protein
MLSIRTPAVLIAAVLALGALAGTLARADDGVPADAPPLVAPDGPFLGVLAKPGPNGFTEDDTPPPAQASHPLVYRGGSVMLTNSVHALYWLPGGSSVSSRYVSLLDRYLADVAHDSKKHTNVYGTDTQYYEQDGAGAKHSIAYSVAVGGSYVDTTPFPAGKCPDTSPDVCLTDSQLKSELSKVIRSRHWHSGYANAFFVVLPRHVDICIDSDACTYSGSGGFCAYHSYYGSGPTIYGVIPYATWLGCSSGQRPNGDDADDTLNGLSHEHNEMITDPTQAGWIDDTGYENGDKCAWTFGRSLGGSSGARYNQTIDGNHYELQEEWSNSGLHCLQRK